jgi:hypothetical protein
MTTDTVNILDMNEDELLAQFKARDRLIKSLQQQLAECQAQVKAAKREALLEAADILGRGADYELYVPILYRMAKELE